MSKCTVASGTGGDRRAVDGSARIKVITITIGTIRVVTDDMSLRDMMVMMDNRMVGSGVDAALHGHSVLHSVAGRVAGLITVPDLMGALISLWTRRLNGIIDVRIRI